MHLTTGHYVLGAFLFVLGWFACRGWDVLVDMFFGAVDGARSILGDALAVVGALTVAVVIGYFVTR